MKAFSIAIVATLLAFSAPAQEKTAPQPIIAWHGQSFYCLRAATTGRSIACEPFWRTN